MARVIESESVTPAPIRTNPSFYFKEGGIVFVRDPYNLQKKYESGEEPHKIRFSSCRLNPSFMDDKGKHICYAQLPVNTKILGVRAMLNYSRTDFHIVLDYCYTVTTKSLEEIEPQNMRMFYLFENEITYSEGDIQYDRDSFLTELNPGEYEISLMRHVGTVVVPHMTTASQPYREVTIHVFARDYSKIMGLPPSS